MYSTDSYCNRPWCNHLITFVRTTKGKNMPCETNMEHFVPDDSSSAPTAWAITPEGKMIKGYYVSEPNPHSIYVYVPHFYNCDRRRKIYERKNGVVAQTVPEKMSLKQDKPSKLGINEQLSFLPENNKTQKHSDAYSL